MAGAVTAQDKALVSQLGECRRQYESIKTRTQTIVDGLTLEQFNWRPESGRWSVAQNLEHLNLEALEQVPVIERLVERGKSKSIHGEGPFRLTRFGGWYIRFLEPPYKTKVPTLDRFKPVPTVGFDEVMPEFMRYKDHLVELVEAANGLHLSKLRAPLTYLRYWNPSLSLIEWLLYIAAHERRHLWQIDNVLNHPDFPR